MKINKNICYGNGQLDCYLPDNEMTSVLVFFHGGGLEGGSKEDAEYFAEYLTTRKIGVVSADYRLYPVASYPDFIEDAAKATTWAINEFDTNIFIGGSSAGAYLSMMLCFDKKYLEKYDVDTDKISGYIFNAGQPTAHFNVLRERGLDNRRVWLMSQLPYFMLRKPHIHPCL